MKKTATRISKLASMPTRANSLRHLPVLVAEHHLAGARGRYVSLRELYRPTLVAVEEGRTENDHDYDDGETDDHEEVDRSPMRSIVR